MAQEIINTGVAPNTGTGDTLLTWATKDNENFSQLFGLFPTPGTGLSGLLYGAGAGAAIQQVTFNGIVYSNGASAPTAATTSQVANTINGFLQPQTAAEIAAGVTPTSLAWPAGDVRRYGAVGNGTTDDSGAIQAALNVAAASTTANNKQPVYLTAGANYFCSVGITIPPTVYLVGWGNDPSQNGFGNTLTFALGVATCVTLGNFNGSPACGMSGVNIWRAAGTIPTGSVGVLVQDGTQVTMSKVGIYRHAVALELAKDPAGVAGGLGFSGIDIYTGAVSDAHLVLNTWAEARFTNCRFGSNGSLDMNCNTYFRITGGSSTLAGAGPNGLYVSNSQCNQGGGGSPTHWLEFVNQVSGIQNVPEEFKFVNLHVENIATGGAFIYSDATWPIIQGLGITQCWFSPDNSGTAFFALNSATTLNDVHLCHNNIATGITLAPTAAITEFISTGNNIAGPLSITGAGTTTRCQFVGDTIRGGGVTFAGTFMGLRADIQSTTGTSFTHSAVGTTTGSINYDGSFFASGIFTPTLTFGGGNTGMTTSAATGSYTVTGNRVHGNFKIVLTALGSSTGGAGIGVANIPFGIINANQANGDGGVIVGFAGTTGIGGSTALFLDAAQGGTGFAINTTTATGVAQLNQAQFTNTTSLQGNFSYEWA